MALRITRSHKARADVLSHAHYIAGKAGLAVSDLFLQATDDAYRQLVQMPRMGASRDYGTPAFAGMRMWPLPRFRNYLIFYRATEQGISILRVLYGARTSKTFLPHRKTDKPCSTSYHRRRAQGANAVGRAS